jgi:hypothetical protein
LFALSFIEERLAKRLHPDMKKGAGKVRLLKKADG